MVVTPGLIDDAVVPRARPRTRRGWLRGVVVAAVVAVLAVVGAGLPLYVFPPQGDATGAELVYVIGPPREPRLELARELLAGDASAMLVSVSSRQRGDGEFAASALPICGEAEVTCATPEPFTTNGEAGMLTSFAAEHEIGKTVVITFTPHVARTRYIFARCYDGEVTVVGVDENLSLLDWVYQYAYQTAAFVKAWVTPCAGG